MEHRVGAGGLRADRCDDRRGMAGSRSAGCSVRPDYGWPGLPACWCWARSSSSSAIGARSTGAQSATTPETATALGGARHGEASRPAAHRGELPSARDGLSHRPQARAAAARRHGRGGVPRATRADRVGRGLLAGGPARWRRCWPRYWRPPARWSSAGCSSPRPSIPSRSTTSARGLTAALLLGAGENARGDVVGAVVDLEVAAGLGERCRHRPRRKSPRTSRAPGCPGIGDRAGELVRIEEDRVRTRSGTAAKLLTVRLKLAVSKLVMVPVEDEGLGEVEREREVPDRLIDAAGVEHRGRWRGRSRWPSRWW